MIDSIDELPESEVEILEQGFVERFRSRLKFMEAQRWSDPFEDYNFEHPNGSLLVQCLNSSFEKIGDNVLKTTHTVAVLVSVRCDFGQTKVNRIIDYTTATMAMHSIAGFNLPVPLNVALQSKDETNWLYEITFTVESLKPIY